MKDEENELNQELNVQKRGSFINGLIVGLAAAVVIFCAVSTGLRIKNAMDAKELAEKQALEAAAQEESFLNTQTTQKLTTIEETLKSYFYLSEVTNEELQEGMYRGMLESLEDPYSEYYTAEEFTDLMQKTQGVYYGIGAYVSLDSVTSLPKISSVIQGTSADAMDIRANDLIYEIDGVATYGKTLTEAVQMIRGEEGTTVKLKLIRQGEGDYLNLEVTRCKVESPTVSFKMLDDETAYIVIAEFDDVTVNQFQDALDQAKAAEMTGLILDLRGNPGGSLNAVVEIARMMLPKGMIVYTEDKNEKRVEYTCDGTNELQVPLVVLVDMNSASASEILAGAIKDHGIGTLVGTTTFGKGIVQQLIPFTDGSAVKVTISSYFTPNGQNIHGIGIEPDVICAFDGEAYYNQENPVDNQLETAREVLQGIREKE